MSDHTRRPLLTAAAISAALAISAFGGGAVLAQPGDEMPTDDAFSSVGAISDGSTADDAAAAAGFTLVTDEMGNTQLVRDPEALGAASDYDDDEHEEDEDDYEHEDRDHDLEGGHDEDLDEDLGEDDD